MGRSKRKAGSGDHDAQSKITKQKYAAQYQAVWTTDLKSLYVLPHGNADCERIFSMVKQIKAEFRNQLGNDT